MQIKSLKSLDACTDSIELVWFDRRNGRFRLPHAPRAGGIATTFFEFFATAARAWIVPANLGHSIKSCFRPSEQTLRRKNLGVRHARWWVLYKSATNSIMSFDWKQKRYFFTKSRSGRQVWATI